MQAQDSQKGKATNLKYKAGKTLFFSEEHWPNLFH